MLAGFSRVILLVSKVMYMRLSETHFIKVLSRYLGGKMAQNSTDLMEMNFHPEYAYFVAHRRPDTVYIAFPY